MSQFPERYRAAIAPLIDKARELLEQGEELYDIVDDPTLFFVPRADADPSEEAPPTAPKEDVLEERQQRLRRSARSRCTESGH